MCSKHHGLPDNLVSDRDPRFTSLFWNALFSKLGTKLTMSSARHPQTDGQTERVNRVVEDILRSFCSKFPRIWGTLLPLVEFAINNAVHASTGHSPFFINQLRHPRMPSTVALVKEQSVKTLKSLSEFLDKRLAVLQIVRDSMAKSQDIQKASADAHGRNNTQTFVVNDMVLLSTTDMPKQSLEALLPRHVDTKLQPRFVGPFRVSRKISDTAYELQLPVQCDLHPVFYVGLLKKYNEQAIFETSSIPSANHQDFCLPPRYPTSAVEPHEVVPPAVEDDESLREHSQVQRSPSASIASMILGLSKLLLQ